MGNIQEIDEEIEHMALRQIVTLPDPILRRKAKPVTKFDKDLRALIDDMIETMREAPEELVWIGLVIAPPPVCRHFRLTRG